MGEDVHCSIVYNTEENLEENQVPTTGYCLHKECNIYIMECYCQP